MSWTFKFAERVTHYFNQLNFNCSFVDYFIFVSHFLFIRYTIRDVLESFFHPNRDSLHSISYSCIHSLILLISVYDLGSYIFFDCFAWFMFLCSINVVLNHFMPLHHQFIHFTLIHDHVLHISCMYIRK